MKSIVVFYIPVANVAESKATKRLQDIKDNLPSDMKEECWTFVLPTKSESTRVDVFNPKGKNES